MRLDLFLKTSRLVKRRTQARALCDAGRVWVDGFPAKAARQVRAGNRVTLNFHRRQIVVEVQEVHGAVGGRRRPEGLYTVVAERTARPGPTDDTGEESDADLHG